MRKHIEQETKIYQLMSMGAVIAEITIVIGFFICFLAILYWAGIF